ncbi:hypothetical protein A2U01_0042851, partial [Trifolium medium]|nr:hypothetical protein [Trifolium medium]
MSNVTRPPDRENAPPPSSSPHTQRVGNMAQEGGEEFLDVDDQGVTGSYDSDMDVVQETPESVQGAASTSFFRYCKQYVMTWHP